MDLNTLILGAVIGAVVSIPFGIFVNFATPWVKSYFENRSLTTKQRKIYILVSQYKHIKRLRTDPVYLNLLAFRRMTFLQIITFLQVVTTGLVIILKIVQLKFSPLDIKSLTDPLIMVMLVYVCTFFGMSYRADLVKALDFDAFKEKTIKKLIKLGGNPEVLDKGESNG